MKGSRVKCSFCDKNFIKKTDHQNFCSNACRVKAYRKRHNIPEPDFAKMSGKMGLGDLVTNTWREEQKRLFELSQEQLEIQKIESMSLEQQIKTLNIAKSLTGFRIQFGMWQTQGVGQDRFRVRFEDYAQQFVREALQGKTTAIERQIQAIQAMRDARQGISKFEVEKVNTSQRNGYKIKAVKENGMADEIFITNAEKALQIKRSETLQMNGEWSEIFGNMASNAMVLIYGKAGSGKSFYVLRFLRYLQKFGSVLFATAEQTIDSVSPIVQYASKLDKTMPLAEVQTKETLQQILALNRYQFIVVDSFSRLDYDAQEIAELQKKHRNTCIIGILEGTKSGDFKGEESWKHICDIMIEIKRNDEQTGEITVIKNRYKNNISYKKTFNYGK